LRYQFRARESIGFGPAGAANAIRGALGRKLHGSESAYARLFHPVQTEKGPSGLADWPRPFVLRAAHLDDRRVNPGESFSFDVHLFETGERAVAATRWLSAAFEELARITAVEMNDVRIDLSAAVSGISRIAIRFVTPTELKSGGAVADGPEFPVLLARVRDRVATLQSLYGDGALMVDFAGLGERAHRVVRESCDLRQVDRMRRSSRTGQVHGLGGFIGEAIYAGRIDEFWPWLQAAEWTGVGRQTVWGKGQIRLIDLTGS